jgi:glutamate synthase (NADPH/NADH) small chain
LFALSTFRDELPARREEIEHAEEEGIKCKFLMAPVSFSGDEKGWVKSMKCVEMALGPKDAKGRHGVEVVPNSEFTMSVDTVIICYWTNPKSHYPANH